MKLALYFGLALMVSMPPVLAGSRLDISCGALAPQVDSLLAAYSHKRVADVLAMTDPHALLVLGTDVSEVADTREKARALLEADFALWGSSEFGAPSFMSCRVSGRLATAAFDVPFTMHRQNGRSDTLTIRFLTVWHEIHGRWYLTQSLNSVPTTGQGAAGILKQSAKSP